MKQILPILALVAFSACRTPTAPEPVLAQCSVFWPVEGQRLTTFCYTPCPPGTAKWAQGATMGYATSC